MFKHQLAGSVKHQLISVNFFMRETLSKVILPVAHPEGFQPNHEMNPNQSKKVQKKYHSFKSLRIKSLQLCRHSILQYLCFFLQASGFLHFLYILIRFSCYVGICFYLQFWTSIFCPYLIHYYIFLRFLNIFRLEAINPRNTLACFKDSV